MLLETSPPIRGPDPTVPRSLLEGVESLFERARRGEGQVRRAQLDRFWYASMLVKGDRVSIRWQPRDPLTGNRFGSVRRKIIPIQRGFYQAPRSISEIAAVIHRSLFGRKRRPSGVERFCRRPCWRG